MTINEDDFLPEASWCIATLGQLRTHLEKLTPEQLDLAVPKLKEWRENAIDLQHEPALMAAEQMRHWETMDKLADAWSRYQQCDLSQEEFEGTIAEIAEAWRRPLVKKMKHLYQNSEFIYCAESLDQCWELFERDTEATRAEDEASDPFEQLSDDQYLRVGSDEPSGEPGEEHQGSLWFMTKKVSEWAAEFAPGHFSGGGY